MGCCKTLWNASQIGGLDGRFLWQGRCELFPDNAPGLYRVGAIGRPQGLAGVLVHREQGQTLLAQTSDDPEALPDQQGSQAWGELIQERDAGRGHPGAPDGQHPRFAAAKGPRGLPAPLLQPGKEGIHLLQVFLHGFPLALPEAQMRAQSQVVLHAH